MQDINFYNASVHLFLAKKKALPYLKTLVLSSWGDFFFYTKPCLQPENVAFKLALVVVR